MPMTIVVADDAADYREVVRAILSPMSDTIVIVGEAEDGEQALALVRRERPDLVITDLIMPRLDGVELTRRIRQELPETKVILMSSYTEDAYRLMCLRQRRRRLREQAGDHEQPAARNPRRHPAVLRRWRRPAPAVHRWIIGVCCAANVMSWTRCVLPVCSSPRPTPSARSEFTHAGVRLAHGARDLRLQRGAREVDLRGTTRSDNRRGIVESTRRGRGAADTCGRTRRAPMSHRSDASIMEG